jgi:hypothetical protein
MVDPRTKEYLRELNRAIEANKNAMNAAEEICTYQNCIESRLKKEISRCDKNRLLQYLPTKITSNGYDSGSADADGTGAVSAELSPSYELWHGGKRRAF